MKTTNRPIVTTANQWKIRAKNDRKNREKIRRLQAIELKLIEKKDKMKTLLKITLLIITLGLLSAWIFNLIDNEKALWAFTVLFPTAIAFWKENKITELKKDIEVLNKQNEMFVKENLRLNKIK